MSAFHLETDSAPCPGDGGFVPYADIGRPATGVDPPLEWFCA